MERIIFHIDVNSAFLSWSAVKMLNEGCKTDIRLIPAIVGGDKETRHGIVLAKSRLAAECKIHTGEPVTRALQKCPGLVIVPPEHKYYREQSRRFISLLHEYTSDIEQVSVDECYLDFTGISSQYESPVAAAHLIKDRIKHTLGFTVNVGISSCKILAKMASDFEKPDKVHTLFQEEISEKMWKLPTGDLFMVGKSCENTLRKLGINTIGQIANTNPRLLELHLKKHGRLIWEFANGIDSSPVKSIETIAKGVGNSTTLPHDYTDMNDIKKVLLKLSESVSSRLRKTGQSAGVVCIEIKYSDFIKNSHQTILEKNLSSCDGIYDAAVSLFEKLWNGNPVRLLGVRATKLLDDSEPVQINLFDYLSDSVNTKSDENKRKKVDEVMDGLKMKYGNDIVNRASLLQDRRNSLNEVGKRK